MPDARNNNENAAVLVIMLWILIILTLLAISVGRRTAIELRLLRYHINRTQALYLAKAGIERIYQEKLNDADKEHDTLSESWSNKSKSSKEPELKDFALGNGKFEVKYGYYESREGNPKTLYGMQDEQAKLNLNTIIEKESDIETRAAEFRILLENILDKSAAIDAGQLTDKLIDWIDDNKDERAKGREDYSDKGIEPKNAPLNRLEEAVMIDGYTADIVNQLANYVTVYGDGKININTAPKEIFLALGLSEGSAEDIIFYRNGKDGEAATDDDAFIKEVTESELKNILKPDNYQKDENTLKKLMDNSRLAVKSSIYRAHAYGTVYNITKEIVTVVKIDSDSKQAEQRYYYEE